MNHKHLNLENLELFFNEYAQNGWACTDQIFQPPILQKLRAECLKLHSEGHFQKSAIGHHASKNTNSAIRGDFTLWLDQAPSSPVTSDFLEFLHSFRQLLNREFFTSLKWTESHFALYPPNAHYEKHVDNHLGLSSRRITFVLYLNENWVSADGGQLSIFSPEDTEHQIANIDPLMGRLIIFRSDLFPHQVEKSLSTRVSITGWFRDDSP